MTIETMDAAIRARQMAFCGPGVERLVDEDAKYISGVRMAHPTFCNRYFCVACIRVAAANGLTETEIAAVLRAMTDTGDDSAWLALVSNTGLE